MALNWQTEFYRYRRYFNNVKRFYLQKKVRVYTEIVLSLLAVTFFLFFAIKPTLITIAGLTKEIKDKKMVAQKLEEKINALNTAQQEYFAVQPDLYLVDQALPGDSQMFLLVKQIEVLSARAEVSLRGVQYSSVEIWKNSPKEGTQKIEFKITAEGEYQNLKNFLFSLNKLRRIIQIKGFAFASNKKEEKKEGLTLSIDAVAFFEKEEK